jgi:hypothetical protein
MPPTLRRPPTLGPILGPNRASRSVQWWSVTAWLIASLALACGEEAGPERASGALKKPRARFVNHSNGTVSDLRHQLMWAKTDNGKRSNYEPAQAFVQEYSAGGHTDWRLPTLAELETLYDERHPGYVPPCTRTALKLHVPAAFELSCATFWSSKHDRYKAWTYNFFHGQSVYTTQESDYDEGALALPVRDLR